MSAQGHFATAVTRTKEKAAAVSGSRLLMGSRNRLALRELERTAGFGLAVLLALDHTAVAGEEAALFQDTPQIGFEIGQPSEAVITPAF
jgi:hypothetical protein